MDQRDELSTEAAAAQLGVSKATVLNYHRRGMLPGRWEWAGLQRRFYTTAAAVAACARQLAAQRGEPTMQ